MSYASQYRTLQILTLALDDGPGYTLTISRDGNSIEVMADPLGQDDKAAGQRVQLRTGRGDTINSAANELAKKMGLKLPPLDG